ncbi:MAG: flavodoxin family protein [Desulfovibrionaceae bacterium]|jgi:putative NADPH-quinone reductase|nr:flavodoxin family protein [Desulfovibrionaceae bacterium]
MNEARTLLAINGSHRRGEGFTARALDAFLRGAAAAGARHEVLYPARLRIAPCSACGKCLFETPGACRHDDAMGEVIARLEAADLLVLASPVHFDGLPSALQKMVERLRVLLGARFEYRDGRTHHLRRAPGARRRRAVVLCTAGNPERESFVTIRRALRRILGAMEWEPAGEFLFPASHLLAAEPDLLAGQLHALERAGEAFAATGSIGPDLLAAANREYVDDPAAVLRQMTETILRIRDERRRAREA